MNQEFEYSTDEGKTVERVTEITLPDDVDFSHDLGFLNEDGDGAQTLSGTNPIGSPCHRPCKMVVKVPMGHGLLMDTKTRICRMSESGKARYTILEAGGNDWHGLIVMGGGQTGGVCYISHMAMSSTLVFRGVQRGKSASRLLYPEYYAEHYPIPAWGGS